MKNMLRHAIGWLVLSPEPLFLAAALNLGIAGYAVVNGLYEGLLSLAMFVLCRHIAYLRIIDMYDTVFTAGAQAYKEYLKQRGGQV